MSGIPSTSNPSKNTGSLTARVPRLRYKNAASGEKGSCSGFSPDETGHVEDSRSTPALSAGSTSDGYARQDKVPASDISSDALLQQPPAAMATSPSMHHPSDAASQIQKKKQSFFGSFLAKEPSKAAFEEMSRQMVAQHGELSARTIPGVPAGRLPASVPKVNIKWDGLPLSVRLQKQEEKENREGNRLFLTALGRSRIPGSPATGFPQRSSIIQERRSSNSTLSSFDSRGGAAHRYHTQHDNPSASSSSASDAIPSSDEVSGKLVSEYALSSTRPTSLHLDPNSIRVAPSVPGNVSDPPAVPAKYIRESSLRSSSSLSSKSSGLPASRFSRVISPPEPRLDASTAQLPSPTASPTDSLPLTPISGIQPCLGIDLPLSPGSDCFTSPDRPKAEEVVLYSTGPNVLGAPATSKSRLKPSKQLMPLKDVRSAKTTANGLQETPDLTQLPAELENRPHSSRARLGLQSKLKNRANVAPWEIQNEEEMSASKWRNSMPVNPKGLTRTLSTLRRRKVED